MKPGVKKGRSCVSKIGFNSLIKPGELSQIEKEVETEIAAAVAFAEAEALEPVSEVERFVTMKEIPA